jgi:hypothetical protein
MPSALFARSPDLQRLLNEGYEVDVRAGHLVVDHVPYVTPNREVAFGTLVAPLTVDGGHAVSPETHTVSFAGEVPSNLSGEPLNLLHSSGRRDLAYGLAVDHMFSSKPQPGLYPDGRPGLYPDWFEQITTYVAILCGPARELDPDATAQTYRVIASPEEDSVFQYLDTASTRAGIAGLGSRLEHRVAIVGLGGTGSYILDLVSKTPATEIHLYDGDVFHQHNAFRSPSAATQESINRKLNKAEYYCELYSAMRRKIFAHPEYVTTENLDLLSNIDFVFLAVDDGEARRPIVEWLELAGKSFVDVGMGVAEEGGALAGLLRVTTSTPDRRDHVREKHRIPFGAAGADDDYERNIQVADLNALNAALAVVRWKRLSGYYRDMEHEHFMLYATDGNSIANDDQP